MQALSAVAHAHQLMSGCGEEKAGCAGAQVYGATHLNKLAPFDLAWVHRKLVADAYKAGDAARPMHDGTRNVNIERSVRRHFVLNTSMRNVNPCTLYT